MEMLLIDGSSRGCALKNVLYVPELAYNLVSVLKATEAGKTVKFHNTWCEFVNESDETITFATKQGSLYWEFIRKSHVSVNAAHKESKEHLWHRRFVSRGCRKGSTIPWTGLWTGLDSGFWTGFLTGFWVQRSWYFVSLPACSVLSGVPLVILILLTLPTYYY
jgi:hypothetical protein